MTPFLFKCSQCRKTLNQIDDINIQQLGGNNNPNPIRTYVWKEIGEKCPRCGHRLKIPPVNVEVKT